MPLENFKYSRSYLTSAQQYFKGFCVINSPQGLAQISLCSSLGPGWSYPFQKALKPFFVCSWMICIYIDKNRLFYAQMSKNHFPIIHNMIAKSNTVPSRNGLVETPGQIFWYNKAWRIRVWTQQIDLISRLFFMKKVQWKKTKRKKGWWRHSLNPIKASSI